MSILMELNQKKGRKDVQNEKLRNAAKPRWGVTADKPRDESKRRRDGSEKRKEKSRMQGPKARSPPEDGLSFF
jgi:hypothetical protein